MESRAAATMREDSTSQGKTIAGVRGEATEASDTLSSNNDRSHPEDDVSPGVARIAAISHNMTRADRIGVFIGVFLIAYAYGLDGTIRSTYQVSQPTVFQILSISKLTLPDNSPSRLRQPLAHLNHQRRPHRHRSRSATHSSQNRRRLRPPRTRLRLGRFLRGWNHH